MSITCCFELLDLRLLVNSITRYRETYIVSNFEKIILVTLEKCSIRLMNLLAICNIPSASPC